MAPSQKKPKSTMDFALLKKYGIPVAKNAFAKNPTEAAAAAKKIGYPVALKLSSEKALHKTEKGAVALGIQNEGALLSEAGRLFSIDPEGQVLVQEMLKPRAEFIVGGKTDPQFGQIVLFGLGGIFVEVLKDKSIRICPIEEEEALIMIRELRTYPILAGARGGVAADEAKLAGIIAGASRLMEKEKLSELYINPLVWTKEGFIAADVRVIR